MKTLNGGKYYDTAIWQRRSFFKAFSKSRWSSSALIQWNCDISLFNCNYTSFGLDLVLHSQNHEFIGAVFLSLDKTPPFLITHCFFPSSYSHYKCLVFWYWPTKCPCAALFISQPLLINSFVCAHIASTSVINYQVMLIRKLIPGNRRILNTEMVHILGHTSCHGWVRLSLGWRLSHKWKPALWNGKTCRENCTHVHAWGY